MTQSMLSRLLRPFDALRSLRGLTAIDEFKVVVSMLEGYIAITISKVLEPARFVTESRFGTTRIEFINRLTNIKYILLRTPDGFQFIIRSKWWDYEMALAYHEPEVMRIFKPRSGDVIVDVGANIGAYTIRPCKVVCEVGLVIALEPEPENLKLLRANVKLNALCNTIILPMAASDHDGTSIMYTKGSGEHTLIKNHHISYDRKINVSTIKLDTLANNYGLDRIDWLKIDVEGAELIVLEGASGILGNVVNIVIEIWNENISRVCDILEEHGYETIVLMEYTWGIYVLAKKREKLVDAFGNPQD